ncbi:hypothetical protein ILUMI_15974 [Ignelater luminosus]|uniref:CBM39 domain-containing protein n=1 Tax=Ignelater luminosus TaxID=2038154 RepID=A0A8K0CMK3_IGNLU|nr:hypothetical protein ILUMI_15974 [Ignelater luminosus]
MWCVLSVLLFIICVNSQNTDSIPPQKLIVSEKGFRISIPDEPGIEEFFFHGNINSDVDFLALNAVILSAKKPINGEWLLEHKREGFKAGDFINYWVHIKRNGQGYTSSSNHYQIKDVLPDYPSPTQLSSRHSNRPKNEAVFASTPRFLSSNWQSHETRVISTPKSNISTSTVSYQWMWPDD